MRVLLAGILAGTMVMMGGCAPKAAEQTPLALEDHKSVGPASRNPGNLEKAAE